MRQFVADASHELRTPLATVRGYAELYRQGAVSNPDDVAGAFGRIESEASRMSGLVEDLLVLARLEVSDHWSSTTSTWPSSAATPRTRGCWPRPARPAGRARRAARLITLGGARPRRRATAPAGRDQPRLERAASHSSRHPCGDRGREPAQRVRGPRDAATTVTAAYRPGGPAGSSNGSTGRTPPAAGATAPPAGPASDWPSSPRSSVRTTERLASGRRPAGRDLRARTPTACSQ